MSADHPHPPAGASGSAQPDVVVVVVVRPDESDAWAQRGPTPDDEPDVEPTNVESIAHFIAEAEERGAARVRERVEAMLTIDEQYADAVSISGRHHALRRSLRAALTDEAAP